MKTKTEKEKLTSELSKLLKERNSLDKKISYRYNKIKKIEENEAKKKEKKINWKNPSSKDWEWILEAGNHISQHQYKTQHEFLYNELGLFTSGYWPKTKQSAFCFTQGCDIQNFHDSLLRILPYIKPVPKDKNIDEEGIIIDTHSKEDYIFYKIIINPKNKKAKVVEIHSHRKSEIKEDWDDLFSILKRFRKYYQSEY